ncbi:hypothetical protein N0V88_005793 [Collariella sp. IMI 366227]|nr:hypothetical protein N0V88_005793 [Collariella sp. IMI 366227]
MPDLGLTTADDMVRNVGMLAGLDRSVPVIADADAGFGGVGMVARTVERYILAGVAGLHIEDQVLSKRCGHLMGKELVDEGTFVARIRTAVAARRRLESDIVIIARTDALQSHGFDEAVKRLKGGAAYLAYQAAAQELKTTGMLQDRVVTNENEDNGATDEGESDGGDEKEAGSVGGKERRS